MEVKAESTYGFPKCSERQWLAINYKQSDDAPSTTVNTASISSRPWVASLSQGVPKSLGRVATMGVGLGVMA